MRNKKIWMLAAVTASVMAQPMTAMAASFPYMQKNGVQVIVGSGNASDWKQILGNAGVNVGSLSGGNWQEQLNQLLQNCDPGLQDGLKDCPILGGGQGNLGIVRSWAAVMAGTRAASFRAAETAGTRAVSFRAAETVGEPRAASFRAAAMAETRTAAWAAALTTRPLRPRCWSW